MKPTILFWGRHGLDYSRNRVLRGLFESLDFTVDDFVPRWPLLTDVEAEFRRLQRPSLVWVPCFRHRDLPAALRWAKRKRIPLLFDPLISAYDKQVFERGKLAAGSWRAERLRRHEQQLLQQADLILTDTAEHARFFAEAFGLAPQQLAIIPVGAEEGLFRPQAAAKRQPGEPLQVLFYGSFIGLQAPQLIVEAARLYQGPPVHWRLVGEGPLLEDCRRLADGLTNMSFDPWQPYERLPVLLTDADLVLGIFGSSEKAARVIPNKVYQALACARPVVTRRSPAYPSELLDKPSGITWVDAGSPQALADAVAFLAEDSTRLPELGEQARLSFDRHFSLASIRVQLRQALAGLDLHGLQGTTL